MAQPSLFEKLWDKKVPQFLGTYLAVGFGVLQFLEFVTRRYELGGSWVDAYLLIWLGAIPAVALLLYYRGLPPRGTGKIASWKRWGIYANLALLLPLLWLLPGTEASAKTQVVATVDEAGKTVQRVVPTSSAVQRLAIFGLQNEENAEEKDWWGTAYGLLLAKSMMQRPEISVATPDELNFLYDRFGAEKYDHLNVATQRKIAQRARQDYFLNASYTVEEGRHEITGTLHKTKDGKSVATLQAVAPDPYLAVDIIKDQIFEYLPDPVVEDESQMALPSSALITDNIVALEAFTKGVISFDQNPGDLSTPLEHFRTSLEKDPSCAPCAYNVGDKLYGQGKKDSAEVMLRQAVRLANVLPERFQFDYKKVMFSVQGEYQSLIRLMEVRKQLYPFEYEPYAMLSSYYRQSIGIDTAIALMQEAATLSNREKALEQLFTLHRDNQDFAAAEEVLKDLEQEYPDPEVHGRRYVSLYRASGEIDKAREALRDMMTLDPLNASLTFDLVNLEQAAGNHGVAEELARKALTQAETYTDSTSMWNGIIRALASSGKIEAALSELNGYEDHLKKVMPINRIVQNDLATRTDYLITIGEFDQLNSVLDHAAKYDAQYAELYRCYLPIQAIIHFQRVGKDAERISACRDQFAQVGDAATNLATFSSYLLEENFTAAREMVLTQLADNQKIIPKGTQAFVFRMAKDFPGARKVIEEARLSAPNEPRLLLELAFVLRDEGKREEAAEVLDRVLTAYAGADSSYVYRLRAEQLAEELNVPLN